MPRIQARELGILARPSGWAGGSADYASLPCRAEGEVFCGARSVKGQTEDGSWLAEGWSKGRTATLTRFVALHANADVLELSQGVSAGGGRDGAAQVVAQGGRATPRPASEGCGLARGCLRAAATDSIYLD